MSVAENRLNLGRRQCEDLRRQLAGLEALAQRLRADARRLRGEGRVAGQPVVAEARAGDLAESLAERHSTLARSVAEIDSQIATVGAALGAAEHELRRYEIAVTRSTPGPERGS
jgi:prefoldin subunit 5